MTTNGNFNKTDNVNTVRIPDIIKNTQNGHPGSYSSLGVGLYYDDDHVYIVDQNEIYTAKNEDPVNNYDLNSVQIAGQAEYTWNMYPTSVGGVFGETFDYWYSIGAHDDLGGPQGGVVFRASKYNPYGWINTGQSTVTDVPDPLIYDDDIGVQLVIYGGDSFGTPVDAIETCAYASLPGPWTLSGNTLPAARTHMMLARLPDDSNIYFYGGYDGADPTNTIWSASAINPTVVTNTGDTLPITLSHSVVYVTDEHIYLFGGNGVGNVPVTTILRATTSAPTTFTSVGNLAAAQSSNVYTSLFVSNDGYIYLYGNSAVTQRAPISDPLTWTTVPNTLSTAVVASHIIPKTSDGYTVMVGGISSGGSALTTIQSSHNSHPLNWTNSVSTLPTGLAGGTLIQLENPRTGAGSYWIIGGDGVTGNLYSASINAPTTWTLADTSSTLTRTRGQAACIDGHVWYFGGETNSTTPVATVTRMTQEGALITSFRNASGNPYLVFNLPLALSRFSLIVAGDYLYILGGVTTGPTMNQSVRRVNRRFMGAPSSIDDWQNIQTLTNSAASSSVTIINNTAYVLGGHPNTSFNTVNNCIFWASMTDLSNGVATPFKEETYTPSAGSVPLPGASVTCINDVVYAFGGGSTATVGQNFIQRTVTSSLHNLIAPRVPESTASIPTVGLVSGALGSYSTFQRTGMLPWHYSKR